MPDGLDLRTERGDGAAAAPAPKSYLGQAGQTRVEALHYSCPCGAVFPARVHRVVNTTRDPELGARVRAGTLNQVVCEDCGRVAEVQVSLIYHDEDERRFILVLPESARTRELWERAELLRLLADDADASVPDYVRAPLAVYGLDGLLRALESDGAAAPAAAQLRARVQEIEERARELDEREAAVAGREGALAVQKREVADGRAEVARRRQEVELRADELAKRERTLLRREEAQTRREAELNERESRLRERDARLAERDLDLAAREGRLREREAQLDSTGPAKLPVAPVPAAPAAGAPVAPSPVPVLRAAAPEESAAPAPRRATLVLPAVAAPPPPPQPLAAAPEPEAAPEPAPEPEAEPEAEGEPEPAPEAPPAVVAAVEPPPPADFGDEIPERTVRAPIPTRRKLIPPAPPPPAVVRRWIESGEPRLACLLKGVPYLAASVPPSESDPFVARGEIDVRVQLHRLPTYPLVTVVVLGGPPEEPERHALTFLLDVGAPGDREVLETLASEFRVMVDLYGTERVPLLSREARAPLAENARYVLSLADEHLKSMPMAQRSLADARRAWLADGFDRLGRRPVAFAEDSFSLVTGPAAARVAASVIEFWSDRENEDYLILVKSFPLPWWRRIRTRVLNAALEHGVLLPPRLQALALSQGLASSKRDLVARLLKAAAEVAEQRTSDLDPDADAENWTSLLAECDLCGVPVDRHTVELAAAVQRRAPAPARPPSRTLQGIPLVGPSVPALAAPPAPAAPTPVPEAAELPAVSLKRREAAVTEPLAATPEIGARDVADLVRDLDRKEARKDAALELARRGERAHVPAIFAAVRRMTRGEAIEVLPALVRFGSLAEREFVEGLDARKSFLRQGCALALGSMKAGEATDALVKLLLEEPTEIWREVARALGDIGAPSVMSLAARIREADVEGRDRISLALAHVAARGTSAPVEVLARGRDPNAAQCAQRALDRVDQVKQQDQEVRGPGGEVRETTMVRSFTRHFFESLAGEERAAPDVVELDASELMVEGDADDAEEELGEEDILEEGGEPRPGKHPRRPRAGR
jgi:hypothetical protein